MKTKHARLIREAVLRARHKNGPDYLWAFDKATKFQHLAFQQAILKMQLRDLREIRKKL